MQKTLSITFFFIFTAMQLFAVTGFGYSSPSLNDTVNPSVSLHTPLPNAIWYVGQIKEIMWTATDTNLRADSIYIFYSLDAGTTFELLAGPIANTGSYVLEMPDLVSGTARVRVKAADSFGNFSNATNPLVLSYAAAPPLQVQNVVVTINGTDALISWLAVTENVMNQPLSPDGYMLFVSEVASDNPADYRLLVNTTATEYLYQNAPVLYTEKFFYVVAYKDDSGRLHDLLQQGTRAGQVPLTLQEIRNRLGESGKGGGK